MSLSLLDRMSRAALLATLATCVTLAAAWQAPAQTRPQDCAPGWVFANGQCEQIRGGSGGGNMDAACQATARFDYCQASASIGCHSMRNGFACRLLQLSNGNPAQFQQIMQAQTACLRGNQQACAFLQQFRGMYF